MKNLKCFGRKNYQVKGKKNMSKGKKKEKIDIKVKEYNFFVICYKFCEQINFKFITF